MAALFDTVISEVKPLQVGEIARGLAPTYSTGVSVASQIYFGSAVFDGLIQSTGGDFTVEQARAIRPPMASDTIGLFRGFCYVRETDSLPNGGIAPVNNAIAGGPVSDYLVAGSIVVETLTDLVRDAPLAVRLTPPASTDWWNVGKVAAVPASPDLVNYMALGDTWTYRGVAVKAGALIVIARPSKAGGKG